MCRTSDATDAVVALDEDGRRRGIDVFEPGDPAAWERYGELAFQVIG